MAVIADELTRTTLEEIEKILTTRTVVGEPVKVDGKTIIPLISIGFVFGVGGGSGKGEAKQKGEGEGGGTGGGAWVRPVAVVINDQQGIRVEPVRHGLSAALDKMGETLPRMVENVTEKMTRKREEGKGETR